MPQLDMYQRRLKRICQPVTDADRAVAIERLKALAAIAEEGDREEPHIEADGIPCEVLVKLGFEDLVDAYNEIEKWWA